MAQVQAVDMKVEVVRKEKIRPSSPTPETLKTYRLSIVDQLGLMMKVPMVFFYDWPDGSATHHHHDIDSLKRSLAITLSLMYPLAGRITQDRLSIECNDEGVDFIEAHVDETVSRLVANPDFEALRKLIPCTPYTGTAEPCLDERVLVVQVNRFRCGGMAIGFIISHGIGDGSSMNTFINTWAAVNRLGSAAAAAASTCHNEFIYDCSTIFPPLSNTAAIDRTAAIMDQALEAPEKYVVQRFIFPAPAIARLRKGLQEELIADGNPSRFEAVTALLWMTVIDAVQMRPNNHTKNHVLSTIVNLRNKMKPPLPKNCLGNITFGVSVQWESTATTSAASYCHLLVPKIRCSVRAVNDDLARKVYGQGDQILQVALAKLKEKVEEGHKKDLYCLYTSSFCGFTFYEADFGWGKPKWMVNVQILRDAVCFIDTKDKGIEAWMRLPKDIMQFLMQNQHFLGYTTCTIIPI